MYYDNVSKIDNIPINKVFLKKIFSNYGDFYHGFSNHMVAMILAYLDMHETITFKSLSERFAIAKHDLITNHCLSSLLFCFKHLMIIATCGWINYVNYLDTYDISHIDNYFQHMKKINVID